MSAALITGRRSLALLGGAGAGLLVPRSIALAAAHEGDDRVAEAGSACTLTAEQEEGPFYVAVDRVRSDLVEDQAGFPPRSSCRSRSSTRHVQAAAPRRGRCLAVRCHGRLLRQMSEHTTGATYLRGVQFTDRHGQVAFQTVFPGHYQGRTTHIHARIHTGAEDVSGKLIAGHIAHTGQMLPSEAVYEQVYALAPYDAGTARIVTHAEYRVWNDHGGSEALMRITRIGHRLTRGLTATITLAVDPSATPAAV